MQPATGGAEAEARAVEALDQMHFRLALSSDEALEEMLQRALPDTMRSLGEGATERVRGKVLEVLSYVSKRLEVLPRLQLPTVELIDMFLLRSEQPVAVLENFLLVFIEKALVRCPPQVRAAQVPRLLIGVAQRPQQQAQTTLHLLLDALGDLDLAVPEAQQQQQQQPASKAPSEPPAPSAQPSAQLVLRERFQFADSEADRQLVLTFLLDVVLFSGTPPKPPPPPPQQQLQPQQPQAQQAQPEPVPPPGLSFEAVQAVLRGGKLASRSLEQWNRIKERVVDFVSCGLFAPAEALPVALVAATSGDERLLRKGEAAYRGVRDVNLDSERELAVALLSLFTGSLDDKRLPPQQRRSPASIPVRLRILSHLSRSVIAANQPSLTVRALVSAVLGRDTTPRLVASGMEFLAWVLRSASDASLQPIASVVTQMLLKLISQRSTAPAPSPAAGSAPAAAAGTAAGPAATEATALVRSMAYDLLGQLGRRLPTLWNGSVKMPLLFFRALDSESEPLVLQGVHEGLALLRVAYESASEEVRQELQAMLVEEAASQSPRRQLAALQYLNGLFPYSDVMSRFVCLRCATVGASNEVRDEARKGLMPREPPLSRVTATRGAEDAAEVATEAKAASDSGAATRAQWSEHPGFAPFVHHAWLQVDRRGSGDDADPALAHPQFLAKTLDFINQCFARSAARRGVSPSEYAANLLASTDGVEREALYNFHHLIERLFALDVAEVQDFTSDSLLLLVAARPQLFAAQYASRVEWLLRFLLQGHAKTRANFASLLAIVAADLPSETIAHILARLTATLTRPRELGDVNERHGALLGVGSLLSWCVQQQSSAVSQAAQEAAASLLVRHLDHSHTNIVAAACTALARVGEKGVLPLPLGSASSAPSTAAPAAAGTMAAASRLDTLRALVRLALQSQERKEDQVVEHAVEAIGRLAVRDRHPAVLSLALRSLFAMGRVKHEEVHFAVGAALADVGAGPLAVHEEGATSALSAPQAQGSLSQGLGAAALAAEEPFALQTSDESAAGEANAAKRNRVDAGTSAPAPGAAAAADADDEAERAPRTAMEHVLQRILVRQLQRGGQVERASAVTWLLCVCKFASRHPLIAARLTDIQAGFIRALSESQQLVQEVAAKGLASLFHLCSPEAQKQLVDALLRTLAVGSRKVTGDTEVAVNPERGEVATYRELVSVATDLGQPDLAYRFLDLASHHAIWNSKFGAAFSLGSILQASAALAPQLESILPRLFRYQFDPNDKIRASMTALWRTLVTDDAVVVDRHYAAIMSDQLAALGSREYRSREAACMAVADLLQGRKWERVGRFLEPLWLAVLSAVDDVKESVRKAAVTLARALTRLSVRLADAKYTPTSEAQQALAVLVPLLLSKGLGARANDARAVSLSALLKIVDVGGALLRPHLSDLVGSLLECMSTLEPAAFSFYQFHTASLDVSPEMLEQLRVSLATHSPLNTALERCMRLVDAESVAPVVTRLSELLRAGVGLPTLVAGARVVIQLSTGPSANALQEHSTELIKVLQQGQLDRSPSVRKTFSSAIGYLCRVAKKKRVAKVVSGLRELYTGERSGEKERLVAALTAAALARRAPEMAKEFQDELVPLGFLGARDPDKDVEAAWKEMWEELVPVPQIAYRLYAKDTVEFLARCMAEGASWLLRKLALRAARDLAAALDTASLEAVVAPLLKALLAQLPGRIWDGKEAALDAIAALISAAKTVLPPAAADEVAAALLEQCQREKRAFRTAAFTALGAVCRDLPSRDRLDAVRLAAAAALQSLADASATAAGDGAGGGAPAAAASDEKARDEAKGAERVASELHAAVVAAAGHAWAGAQATSRAAHWQWWTQSVLFVALGSGAWNVRAAALGALKATIATSEPALLDEDLALRVAEAIAPCARDGKHLQLRTQALEVLLAVAKRPEVLARFRAPRALASVRATLQWARDDKEPAVQQLVQQAAQHFAN